MSWYPLPSSSSFPILYITHKVIMKITAKQQIYDKCGSVNPSNCLIQSLSHFSSITSLWRTLAISNSIWHFSKHKSIYSLELFLLFKRFYKTQSHWWHLLVTNCYLMGVINHLKSGWELGKSSESGWMQEIGVGMRGIRVGMGLLMELLILKEL